MVSTLFYDANMNRKLTLKDFYILFHFEHKIKAYLKRVLFQEAGFLALEDLDHKDQLIAGNQ